MEILDEKTQSTVAADMLHCILLGGDQLTWKRAETAKESRKNSTTPVTQLRGLIPVCEDWHAKKIFLEVRQSTTVYIHAPYMCTHLHTCTTYFHVHACICILYYVYKQICMV